MKFKSKPEKGNIIMMVIILIMLLGISLVWLFMKEYVYSIILILITIIIGYIYFFSYYVLEKKHFVAHLGFFKIKYDYKKIKDILENGSKVKINLSNYSLDIYPDNKEKFVKELKKKIKKGK